MRSTWLIQYSPWMRLFYHFILFSAQNNIRDEVNDFIPINKYLFFFSRRPMDQCIFRTFSLFQYPVISTVIFFLQVYFVKKKKFDILLMTEFLGNSIRQFYKFLFSFFFLFFKGRWISVWVLGLTVGVKVTSTREKHLVVVIGFPLKAQLDRNFSIFAREIFSFY